MSNTENVLSPCSQDWLSVRLVHTRKRELLAAGIAAHKITSSTEWVQYGRNRYPRTTYTATVEYFSWPINNVEVDAAIEQWSKKAPEGARVTTYYHCAD